jgi:hypothetical protein
MKGFKVFDEVLVAEGRSVVAQIVLNHDAGSGAHFLKRLLRVEGLVGVEVGL